MLVHRVEDILSKQVDVRPASIALRQGERERSFAELGVRSTLVANALSRAGIAAGDRVALLDHNDVEFFEVLFGVAKIGAVVVPIRTGSTPEELRSILQESGASLLLAGPEFADDVEQVASERSLRWITIADRIALGTYPTWVMIEQPFSQPVRRASADDVLVEFFAPCPGGRLHRFRASHENLLAPCTGSAEAWALDRDSVSLVGLPLCLANAMVWCLATLDVGATLVLVRQPTDDLGDALEAQRVTNLLVGSTTLRSLLTPGLASSAQAAALTHVRSIVNGDDLHVDTTLRAAQHTSPLPVTEGYAIPETAGPITHLTTAIQGPQRGSWPAGQPFSWVVISIRDQQTGDNMPPGEVGEIVTRSAQNLLIADGGACQQRFVDDDGWLHTADHGYLDAQGALYVTGQSSCRCSEVSRDCLAPLQERSDTAG